MNTLRSKKLMTMLLVGALAVMTPQWAMAANNYTAACTDIANTANVDYKVGGIDQTPGTGSVTFKVGNRVKVTVANFIGAYDSVIPGETNNVLTFTITNDGNYTQDYKITVQHEGAATYNGVTDNYDFSANLTGAETWKIYIDGGNDVLGGDDTEISSGGYLDAVAKDATKKIYVVYTPVALSRTNGQTGVYSLLATTETNDGTAGTGGGVLTPGDNQACGGTAPVVFGDDDGPGTGDTDRDGEDSELGAYKIVTAAISVTKGKAVYSDPINNTTNAKAIPGAVITYTITVDNTGGGANATNVSVTDSLDTEIDAGRLAFVTQYNDGTTSCTADNGIVVNDVCKTNASDADSAEWNAQASPNEQKVIVTGLTVNAGQSATIKFQATIQ